MNLVNSFPFLTCNCINGGETVLAAGNRIFEIDSGGEGAAHYLEVRYFTEVLLNGVLVDED